MLFSPLSVGSLRATQPSSEAVGTSPEVRQARTDAELAKCEVERLLIITEALWTILKEQHGYDDNELIRRVAEIDLRDGKLDGKLAKEPPTNCPHCNRTMIKRRPYCMYCGKPVAVNPFDR